LFFWFNLFLQTKKLSIIIITPIVNTLLYNFIWMVWHNQGLCSKLNLFIIFFWKWVGSTNEFTKKKNDLIIYN